MDFNGATWFFLLLGLIPTAFAVTPYQDGQLWTYYLEARRAQTWPSCQYRFVSYPGDCSSINLWNGDGANQEFTLVSVSPHVNYLKTKCGTYVSYSASCDDTAVGTSSKAGAAQEFRIADAGNLGWSLEAVGRAKCETRFAGFPTTCSTSGPDKVVMQTQEAAAGWNAHAASSQLTHTKATPGGCADPFAWRSSDGKYRICCTGGNLAMWESSSISSHASFSSAGQLLGGNQPAWAKSGQRWAPENVEVGNGVNVVVFADTGGTSDGKHRVGWAMSKAGPSSGKWSTYSKSYLNLGNSEAGEIDAHVFTDDNGDRYLVWKTDDNSVGSKTTRIWAQQCEVSADGLVLKGNKKMIMDSAGLWWVDSWIGGGSLVEGPEIVRRGKYYYLFFAAGKYCKDSYSEGVARATSVWGPYAKLGVPLLSTNMVGKSTGGKLVGPGHASYLKDANGDWHAVWHASEGENCNRHAYADALGWSSDGWPFVDFNYKPTPVLHI